MRRRRRRRRSPFGTWKSEVRSQKARGLFGGRGGLGLFRGAGLRVYRRGRGGWAAEIAEKIILRERSQYRRCRHRSLRGTWGRKGVRELLGERSQIRGNGFGFFRLRGLWQRLCGKREVLLFAWRIAIASGAPNCGFDFHRVKGRNG
jgi:hypothetical protein